MGEDTIMTVGPESPARVGILPAFSSACAALGSFTEVSPSKHLATWLHNSPNCLRKQQMEAQWWHQQQLLCRGTELLLQLQTMDPQTTLDSFSFQNSHFCKNSKTNTKTLSIFQERFWGMKKTHGRRLEEMSSEVPPNPNQSVIQRSVQNMNAKK